MPLTLLTNDDGVDAPALEHLALAFAELGDVLICAPRFPQSAMGRSYPRGNDHGIIKKYDPLDSLAEDIHAYSIVGSPALAVANGLLRLGFPLPDLCVSGINHGVNIGASLTSSGTVGAALEANDWQIPSIAISLQTQQGQDPHTLDWMPSTHFAMQIAAAVRASGIPSDVSILNVNVPASATTESKIVQTQHTLLNYYTYPPCPDDVALEDAHNLGCISAFDPAEVEPGSDLEALCQGNVSVTPVAKQWASKTSVSHLLGRNP